MANDNVQHGIDDNPSNDAEKGAALGGLGGAAVGAAAGSLAGPVGTIIGAVAGGLIGAGASGAAVAAIDAVDNDNTVSGVGDGSTTVGSDAAYSSDNVRASSGDPVIDTGIGGHNVVTGGPATTEAGNTGLAAGALTGGLIGTVVGGPVGAVVGGTLGSLAGGVAGDAAEAADDNASLAADTNYSGSAFQADALTNPDVTPLQPGYTRANDDVLSPSTQTDYRNVDNGVAGIGGTDTNADVAPLGGYSNPVTTPGVEMGRDVGAGESDNRGFVNDDVDLGTDPADTSALGTNSATYGQSSGDVGGRIV